MRPKLTAVSTVWAATIGNMADHENLRDSNPGNACVTERDMLLSALDTLAGGLIIIDAEQIIVAANKLAVTLLDIPESLVKPGSRFRDFARFAAERGDYGEGDVDENYNRVMSVLDHLEPYELTRRRPDGVILEINGNPIPGGGFVTRFRDVTAELQQEADLADATRSSQRFKRFFELSQEMMGIAGKDGRLHTMNSAWTKHLGWTSEELGAKPFIDFVSTEDRATVMAALNDLHSGKNAAEFAVRFTGKIGDDRWLEWHVAPDSDGQLFCVVHDVNDRRHYQHDLEQARAAAEAAASSKADFLATMSHEIRTPMNGIIGMANLLLDTDLEAEQRHYAESVVDSGEALLAIIDDILDISKMEAGKLEIDEQDFSIEKVVGSVIDVVKPRAMEKRLELATFVAPEVASWVRGDSGKLRQILVNLLGNAIKFTDAGAVSVRITIDDEQDQEQHLRFEVKDTGIGIPDRAHSHLFMRYSQADASTNQKYGGTGLGLSICKQLTEMMGGNIGFESEADVGSTFWFTLSLRRSQPPEEETTSIEDVAEPPMKDTLPMAETEISPAKRPDASEAAKPNNLRVLLVEDNAVNQMLAMAILKKAGHRVDLATDGVEAVESVSNNIYDVVLMDIQMPNMDGLEATRRIRAMDDAIKANVYIVAITANALLGDRETCLSAGMNDYLPKPIDQKRLLGALEVVKSETPAEPEQDQSEEDKQVVFDEAVYNHLVETVGDDAAANMVSITIASAPATMALIQAANAEGDLEKMYREAYDMGSNFNSLGAARLNAHIIELTKACRDGRAARASLLANQMPEILDEAVAAIKASMYTSVSRVA
jgi:PAS domain S-box-containing protein